MVSVYFLLENLSITEASLVGVHISLLWNTIFVPYSFGEQMYLILHSQSKYFLFYHHCKRQSESFANVIQNLLIPSLLSQTFDVPSGSCSTNIYSGGSMISYTFSANANELDFRDGNALGVHFYPKFNQLYGNSDFGNPDECTRFKVIWINMTYQFVRFTWHDVLETDKRIL